MGNEMNDGNKVKDDTPKRRRRSTYCDLKSEKKQNVLKSIPRDVKAD